MARRPAPAPANTDTSDLLPEPARDLDDLLVALAASPELARARGAETICRLGASAVAAASDPALADWTSAPVRELGAIAARLGIRQGALRDARTVADRRAERAVRARAEAARLGARLLTLADADYPKPLLDLELPPVALWVRGELRERPGVAIVGPRNADRWALETARGIAHDLAAAGLVVVSGFARGIDVTAHRAALEAPEGRTVAVLGCGLGVPYPSQHHELASAISEAGAVVSESACGAPPAAWRFPVRNRIIAALALATVVVQASLRSGSLITARLALDLGREVHAVPGRPTDRRSRGSNRLLRDGAHVVLDASSILDTLPSSVLDRLATVRGPERRAGAPDAGGGVDAPLSELVLAALHEGVTLVEDLARRLELRVDVLLAELLDLELAGRVERLSRREYRASSR